MQEGGPPIRTPTAFIPCLLLALGPLLGCGAPTPADFTSVTIEQVARADPAASPRTTTITDPALIRELWAFFPGLGTGAESPIADLWEASWELRFTRPDGSELRVAVDYWFETWSEGKGDWDIDGNLVAFLEKLVPGTDVTPAD